MVRETQHTASLIPARCVLTARSVGLDVGHWVMNRPAELNALIGEFLGTKK